MQDGIVIGDIEHPALSIVPYEKRSNDQQLQLRLREENLTALEGLIRQIPGLVSSSTSMASQTYVMHFAPEVASRLTSGSAEIMRALDGGFRAVAVGPNGQIIGSGRLVPQSGLGAIGAATAVWQVLAVVTAQYYLVGIQHKLASIEEKLDDIRNRMHDQELGTLINNFKRLRSIQTAVAACRLTELDLQSFVAEVDAIDRECGQIMETALLRMDSIHHAIGTMSLQGTLDPSREVHRAQQHIATYLDTAEVWHLAAMTRIVAAEARCSLPVDVGVAQQRLDEIQQELQPWEARRIAFVDLVLTRSKHVSSKFSVNPWKHSDHFYRDKVQIAAKRVDIQLNRRSKGITRGVRSIKNIIVEQLALHKLPLSLLVDMNAQGKVTAVHQLLPKEATKHKKLTAQ